MSSSQRLVAGHSVPEAVVSLLSDPIWVEPEHRPSGWAAALRSVTGFEKAGSSFSYLAAWPSIDRVQRSLRQEVASWPHQEMTGDGLRQALLENLVFFGDLHYQVPLVLDYSAADAPSVRYLIRLEWITIRDDPDEFAADLYDALAREPRFG